MQPIISIISGMLGFIIISAAQMNIFLMANINNAKEQLEPAVYSVGMQTKLIAIALGLIAIVSAVLYKKRKARKLRIINQVGMLLGIIAIILCFIPLYLISM